MTKEQIEGAVRAYRSELDLMFAMGTPDPEMLVVLCRALRACSELAAQILSPEPPLEEEGGGEET